MVTLGLDLDGTMADTWGSLLRLMESRHNIRASKSDIRSHTLIENEPFKRLTQEQATEAFVDVWKDYKSIKLEHHGIPEIITYLKKKCDGIAVVTSTIADRKTIHNYLEYRSIDLNKVFWFDDPAKKIHSNMDIIVDDYSRAIEAFANAGRIGVLLAQPWNEEFRTKIGSSSNIKIAMDWSQIPEIVLNIPNGKNTKPKIAGIARK
jgi:hypothetical protein